MDALQLETKMREVIKLKLEQLETTPDDIVDYPILEEEISDACNVWILLRSINPNNRKVKVDEIDSIYRITTSGTIYDAVEKFLKEEGVIK